MRDIIGRSAGTAVLTLAVLVGSTGYLQRRSCDLAGLLAAARCGRPRARR